LDSLRLVADKVKDFLNQSEAGRKPAIELNASELAKELQKLSKAFEEIDTKTIGLTLTNLKASSLPADLATSLDKITDCFFEVEYDQAVSLINSLLIVISSGPAKETGQTKKLLN
jgi:hypothetical protein